MLQAIGVNFKAFQCASKELRIKPEFVLEAIEVNFDAFQFAAEEFRSNWKFVLLAIGVDYGAPCVRLNVVCDMVYFNKRLAGTEVIDA